MSSIRQLWTRIKRKFRSESVLFRSTDSKVVRAKLKGLYSFYGEFLHVELDFQDHADIQTVAFYFGSEAVHAIPVPDEYRATGTLRMTIRHYHNLSTAIKFVLHRTDGDYSAILRRPEVLPFDRISIEKQYEIWRPLQVVNAIGDHPSINGPSESIILSIIVPVFQPDLSFLKKCIDSIANQKGSIKFQLIVCVDADNDNLDLDWLNAYQWTSFTLIKSPVRLHISENLNQGLKEATGAYCLFVDQDDKLASDAVIEIARVIESHNPDLIYSDEDKIDSHDRHVRPILKPDFDIDYLRCTNYINHLTVVRRTLGERIGWFRSGYEGAQDHDLLLRLSGVTDRIYHIPKILYHWRMSPGSTAQQFAAKSYARDAGIKALRDHASDIGVSAEISQGRFPGLYSWHYQVDPAPKVAIVSLPGATSSSSLESLHVDLSSTDYSDWQHVQPANTGSWSVILNKAIADLDVDIIGILTPGSLPVDSAWISGMVGHLMRSGIGAVGSKLVADGRLQHAGLVLGWSDQPVGYFMKGMDDSHPGYFRKDAVRQVSACTLNGLFFQRQHWERAPFEEKLDRYFLGLDFCLNLREQGLKVLYNPASSVSVGTRGIDEDTRIKQQDQLTIMDKWRRIISQSDPHFNVNLSTRHEPPAMNLYSAGG